MSKRWQVRVWLATLAVLLVIGVFLVRSRLQRPVARLASGMQLTLLGVTHGPTNTFFPGGKLDEMIHRLFSAKGIQLGPLKIKPAAPLSDDWRKQDGSTAFPNKSVVWIGHRGPTNLALLPVPEKDWFKEIRATMADEMGEEWEMRPIGLGQARSTNARGLSGITAWSFSAFPRRGKTLHFRLYARNTSEAWDTLADFPLANPTPGPHPVWTPSSLPAVQTNGDLVVSLVEFVSGRKSVHYYPGERPFTKVVFEVKENGQVTEAWLPDRMQATDATGNEPWAPMVNYRASSNQVFYEIQVVNLSPTEVWKLQTRFAKAGDQTTDGVWTSPKLPVVDGRVEPTNLRTNWHDGVLTLKTSNDPFPDYLHLKLDPLPTNAVWRLGEFLDDQGRKVTYTSGFLDDSGFEVHWKIPDGAAWIRVTMRLVETRTVEFIAQPTRHSPRPTHSQ